MPKLLQRIRAYTSTQLARAAALQGIKRSALLFVAGAFGVFFFAPFNLWPLLFIIMPLFFTVLNSAENTKRALLDGFCFGYGYFMASTYWIAISLTVDAASYAWLIPFSVFGLSALFAMYVLLFAVLYHRLKTNSLWRNALLFAALWVGVEYLRSIGMFGFPWNLLGYSTVSMPFALAGASVVGVFGQSLWLLLVALSAYLAWLQPSRTHTRFFACAAIVALSVVLIGYVVHVFGSMPKSERYYHLRVVQPNIPQTLKWQPQQVDRILRTLATFTQLESKAPTPDIIVWPETAVPFTLRADSEWLSAIAKWVPQKSVLIFGAITQKAGQFGNGLSVLNSYGGIEASYLKRQLVPFGEFVPFRKILPLNTIANIPSDFMRGAAHSTLSTAGKPTFLPMICYESAFPWLAESETERPDYLLTITNDAWFGNSPGPHQHFAMSRMRAAEQGLPVVRAANTGISAIIDARGKVLHSLALGSQGIIDARLPKPLSGTPFTFYGQWLTILCLLTIFLLVMRYRKSTKG